MYEATVSVTRENGHLLDYVKKCMEPVVAEVDGITGELTEKFRQCFSLACADTYRLQVRRKLAETVSQTLALGYKNVYVRRMLHVDKDDFYQNVLVNTLCIFDSDCDRQIISRVLDPDEHMSIDGYYNFRLDSVKRKWQEIIRLVNDNFYVLTDSQMIEEFLQYLIESMPSKVKHLSVSVNADDFVLYGTNGKVIEPVDSMAKDATAEEEMILNLLWLKPQRVTIYHGRPLSNEFRKVAEALFTVEYKNVT